jgi:hypothetical protein
MDQSVMSFAGTAARGSAIPSPVEGMVAYLEDTNFYTAYNGSAWVNLAALSGAGSALITSQSVTSANSIIFNNCFSSAFRGYKIVIQGTAVSRGFINARLRASGADASGSNYINSYYFRELGSFTSSSAGATVQQLAYQEPATVTSVINITDPFLTTMTSYRSISGSIGPDNGTTFSFGGGHQLTNSYDGLTFLPDSAFTGTIAIYGVRI